MENWINTTFHTNYIKREAQVLKKVKIKITTYKLSKNMVKNAPLFNNEIYFCLFRALLFIFNNCFLWWPFCLKLQDCAKRNERSEGKFNEENEVLNNLKCISIIVNFIQVTFLTLLFFILTIVMFILHGISK